MEKIYLAAAVEVEEEKQSKGKDLRRKQPSKSRVLKQMVAMS